MSQDVVEPVAPAKPFGRYRVQVINEDGSVDQEHVVDNYITPVWEQYAKATSLRNLHLFGFPRQPDGAALWRLADHYPMDDDGDVWMHPWYTRSLPFSGIVLTDWTASEDPTQHKLRGEMSAWGSLWKSAEVPADGPRGQLNEAECTVDTSERVMKWVWDWSTQQGNGEYQTLAIGAPAGYSYPEMYMDSVTPWGIAGLGPNLDDIAPSGGIPDPSYLRGVGYNPVTKRWVVWINDSSGTGNQRWLEATEGSLATLDAARQPDNPSLADLSALTWTEFSTTAHVPMTTGNSSTAMESGTEGRYASLFPTSDGGLVMVHTGAGSFIDERVRLKKIAPDGTTLSYDLGIGPEDDPGTYWDDNADAGQQPSIVEVGSFYYALLPSDKTASTDESTVSASYKKVVRIDPSDGSFSANVPLPSGHFVISGSSIFTDGTDLFLTTNKGILQMQTDGTKVQVFGSDQYGTTSEEGASPYYALSNTQYQYEFFGGGLSTLAHSHNLEDDTRSVSVNPQGPQEFIYRGNSIGQTYITRLNWFIYRDGIMYRMNYGGSSAKIPNSLLFFALAGQNMFSRAVLDSPVTKNSSQTMKVSWELTFPDMWNSSWELGPEKIT